MPRDGAGRHGGRGALAATIRLEPGESRTIPFAWRGTSRSPSSRSGRAGTAATRRSSGRPGGTPPRSPRRAARARPVVGAIDAGRRRSSPTRAPDWYAGALFNELYFMVDGGTLWTDGPPMPADGWVPTPGADPAAGGPFGGSPRSSASTTRSTTRSTSTSTRRSRGCSCGRAGAGRHPRVRRVGRRPRPGDRRDPVERQAGDAQVPGALPHDVGGPRTTRSCGSTPTATRTSTSGRTSTASSSSRSGATTVLDDPELLRDAWPGIVTALEHVARFDRDGDGLPEHDGDPDQTYDTWPMTGPSAYCGGLWLAALRAAIETGSGWGMATRTVAAAVARFKGWLAAGTAAYESRLWTGTHYRYDDGGGPRRTRSWPTSWPASGTPTRPASATSSRRSG